MYLLLEGRVDVPKMRLSMFTVCLVYIDIKFYGIELCEHIVWATPAPVAVARMKCFPIKNVYRKRPTIIEKNIGGFFYTLFIANNFGE